MGLAEVAKHTTKTDCWVVVNGQVLNATNFLKDHPGGELAILTFAGKDASEEFNMIHPPDVIPKYAPDAVIGGLGEGDLEGGNVVVNVKQDAPVVSAAAGRSSYGVGEMFMIALIIVCGSFTFMVLGFNTPCWKNCDGSG